MHTNETLYVVTAIFNPFRFKSRSALYHKFAKYIEDSGAILITVEVAWNGRMFECTKPYHKNHVQLRTESIMWHKEALLNIGIDHVRKTYPQAKKVAWIDADVSFSNPNWVEETLFELDHYDVMQLFSFSQSLNPKNTMQWQNPSIFNNFVNKIGYTQKPPKSLSYIYGGHPGLAWAAKLCILEQLGGLMDFCIHGSADTHMAFALMGERKYDAHIEKGELKPDDFTSQGYKDRITDWKSKCDTFVAKNIGYLHGICFHYWHGRSQLRGYKKRYSLIQFHKFDPDTDLVRDNNGLYRWAGNKKDLERDLRLSFLERNEDGTEE